MHRGATAIAPENTLEAYAAAMDYGADGCEMDLRRTSDGVLAMFHDDMLDHLTNGFGVVSQLTYYELLSLHPRFLYGTAKADTRPPTFISVLRLARQRAMLLHLDVKETGLDDQIAQLLTEADAWDHVIAVNAATAPKLARDPRVKGLRYKTSGLYDQRRDVDPAAIREALTHPGELLMVDDPRVAAHELKREIYKPVPLQARLREEYAPAETPMAGGELQPPAHLRSFEKSLRPVTVEKLLGVLTRGPESERTVVDGTPEYQRKRTEHIIERAWAAQRLGELGKKTPAVIAALEEQVRHRSLHRDWMYHGMDGAMAARALGMLHATESAPALVAAFELVDPALKAVVNPEFGNNPLAWTDFRVKMYVIPALGDLRCAASKSCLQKYLAMDEAQAREIAPNQFEEVTRALLRQDLSESDIEALLKSRHGPVRGTAVLECLDHPSRRRTTALRNTSPWALELPAARR